MSFEWAQISDQAVENLCVEQRIRLKQSLLLQNEWSLAQLQNKQKEILKKFESRP
jgi:hypothetical protein